MKLAQRFNAGYRCRQNMSPARDDRRYHDWLSIVMFFRSYRDFRRNHTNASTEVLGYFHTLFSVRCEFLTFLEVEFPGSENGNRIYAANFFRNP